MLIVHQTKLQYIDKILKDGEITPFSENNNLGFAGGAYEGQDLIYLTVLFKDFLFYFQKYDQNVFLFFDDQLLKEQEPTSFCASWNFGDFDDQECLEYNPKISIYQNYKSWEKIISSK